MSEQRHPLYNKLRAAGLAAVAIGTLAVGACTSGETPNEHSKQTAAHLPGDDFPTIESAASTLPIEQYSQKIDMERISEKSDVLSPNYQPESPKFEKFQFLNPVTKQEEPGSPWLLSAPILDIMLGSDNKLHFKDHTPDSVSNEESKILSAVQENSRTLTAGMKAGTIESVRFRVNEPLPHGSEIEDTSYPVMFSQDVHEGDPKPVAYYFLPGRGYVDVKTLATMTSHEAAHGMLKHGVLDLKTGKEQSMFTNPGERETFIETCSELRKLVSEDIRLDGWMIQSNLEYLREQVPRKYRKVFDEVSDAFSNGAYYKLPTVSQEQAEVPTCEMQHPLRTIRLIAEQRGIDTKALDKALENKEAESLMADIFDDWNGMLEKESLLANLCESQYLPPNVDQEDAGHPQDGVHELMASTYSITINYPKELGQNIKYLQPEQQAVMFKVIDGTFAMLKTRYAKDAEYIKLIEERQAAVHAAAGQ